MTNFLAVLLGVLPGLIWLFFYLQEDIHPEPRRLILTTLVVGGLAAVPVMALQLFLTEGVLNFFNLKNALLSIAALALIEEFFKFAAAYWVTENNPEFDEPIDAMIYLITAALGFATIENVLIMGNILAPQGISFLTVAFNASALRFIGATLLHTLASGILGYYWALGIIKKSLLPNLGWGLFLAVLIHSIFNYLIIKFQSINFLYPSIFLILAAIFVLIDFEKLRKML